MRLVLFTANYPYNIGEEFLENELPIAEKYFDEIFLISLTPGKKKITKYVPKNAIVIPVRAEKPFQYILNVVCSFFSFITWKEIIHGCKENRIHSFKTIIIRTVAAKAVDISLRKNEYLWNNKPAVFLSYWLDGVATYLACAKKNNRIEGFVASRAHGSDLFDYESFHPFREIQGDYLDRIFSISEAGKSNLISQGISENKIFVRRLGTNVKGFLQTFSDNRIKRIVSCSLILDEKNLDVLIEALSLIENTNLEWIHFGDGEDGERIRKLAKERLGSKCNINVKFKGFVPNADIIKYYATNSVTAFINCSDREGIPVSIMEAMAFGIPAIAKNVGGNGEIVRNNVNGYLLSADCSVNSIAYAITDLLEMNKNDMERLRKGAFETYYSMYNGEINYNLFWKDIVSDYNKKGFLGMNTIGQDETGIRTS